MTYLRGALILLPERAVMFETLVSCRSLVRAAGEDRPDALFSASAPTRGVLFKACSGVNSHPRDGSEIQCPHPPRR